MRWLCCALVFALSGCASWRDIPDDVKFVSFHSGSGPYQFSKRGEAIDVEIETNLNYINYVGTQHVNVEFFFCEHPEIDVQGLGGLGLYKFMDKWVEAGRGAHDSDPPPYRYHTAIFADIHDKTAMVTSKNTILDYDLREIPRDICFYLDAGYYSHEKSNIVRIPKEELIKFFDEHPRPQTGATQ